MQLSFARRFVLATLALLAFGALRAAATPPADGKKDLLDEARRRDQVAQQKAEADFRDALIEMSKLEYANPAKAAVRLKKMLAVLEEDTVLSPAKRDAWKRVLKDRIRVSEAEADRVAKQVADGATREATKDARSVAADQKARDEQRLKQDLKAIRQAQKDGRDEDAARLASDVARRHPDSPSAIASSRITGTRDRLNQYRLIKSEKENGWALSMLDVDRSSVLPKDPDFNFPSPQKWKEITKARTKSQATEKEKAILKALESPVTVSFEGSTLESAIDYLQTLSGQTIIVDKSTLDEVGINYDTPVNVRKMRRVSLRTVLRKVLGEVGLTYVVEKETIHVLTPAEARKKMTVRTYYLGDLAGAVDYTFGPAFSGASAAVSVAELIKMIVGTVEPDSWKINNAEAEGTIIYNPASFSLIVKQSAEIHYMLGGLGGR
jgi:type II secretory pathway component GspD/PulD (secretin)